MPAALYNPTLEEVQFAQEAAWGDAAVPTIGLTGVEDCKMTPRKEFVQIKDKRASAIPAYISALNRTSGEATLSGVFTYTQGEYLLNAMFALDASSPHAYIAAVTPVAPVSWNLLYGQSGLCYSMAGALMDKLVLKYDTNGPIRYEAHFQGKEPVSDVREALVPPTCLIGFGHQTVLSIDTLATAHGTTPLALTSFTAEASIENSRHPVWHMGTLNPDNYTHGVWGGSLRLVLEMTAATKAYLTASLAETVEADGFNIRLASTSGADVLLLDFSGHLLTTPPMYTEVDGVTTCELVFAPAYSAQAAMLSCWKASLTAA